MKIYYFLILVFFVKVTYGQNSKIDSLFKLFQRDIEIEQIYHNGTVVFDDDTKESYYSLMSVSPTKDLLKFVNDSNPAIRCIVFRSLLNKNADKKLLNKILENHRNDTAVYKSQSADVKVDQTVFEYMERTLKYSKPKVSPSSYKETLHRLKQYPKLIIPGLRHQVIRKEKIASIDSLVYNNKGLKLLSFTLVSPGDSATYSLKSGNNFFTPAMKEKIKQLNSGDVIIIDEIKVLTQDGYIRTYPSNIIRIE